MEKPTIGIIGVGRVGTTLADQLIRKRYPVKILITPRPKPQMKKLFPGISISSSIHKIPSSINIIFICTSDDAISSVVKELTKADLQFKTLTVFHVAGSLTSDVLKPLKMAGAGTGSVHPIQTFTYFQKGINSFRNIYFDIEGDAKAMQVLKKILKDFGSNWVVISKKAKPYVHIASIFLSNYITTLAMVSDELFTSPNLRGKINFRHFEPLVNQTIDNMKRTEPSLSLTGPIIRGDFEIIRRHLILLKKNSVIRRAYIDFGRITLKLALKKQKISQQTFNKLSKLFR